MNAQTNPTDLEIAPATFTDSEPDPLAGALTVDPGADKLSPEEQESLLRLQLFAPVYNKSRAQKVAQAILGPLARTWTVTDAAGVDSYEIGEQHHDGHKVVFGVGPTYQEALAMATKDLHPDLIAERTGPTLRQVHGADRRIAASRSAR